MFLTTLRLFGGTLIPFINMIFTFLCIIIIFGSPLTPIIINNILIIYI